MNVKLFATMLLTSALVLTSLSVQAGKNKDHYQRALNGDKCLCGTNLEEANFENKSLCGADLRGAYLREAELENADLRGANLCGANLEGADLEDADLRGACVTGANFAGAEFGNTIWVDGRIISAK